MKAFHDDVNIKQKYIERVKAHQIADEIIKGTYWKNGKGCAVGCTLHSAKHANYEIELGISRILARLEDMIFENLPNELAKTWPLRFLESIEVGADLSKVWSKFAIFLLTDSTQCNSRHPQCSIVAKNFESSLLGNAINWLEIKREAKFAAAYAAAAYAAADAAAAAAAYAADAKQKAYMAQSEKLLQLLKECN